MDQYLLLHQLSCSLKMVRAFLIANLFHPTLASGMKKFALIYNARRWKKERLCKPIAPTLAFFEVFPFNKLYHLNGSKD